MAVEAAKNTTKLIAMTTAIAMKTPTETTWDTMATMLQVLAFVELSMAPLTSPAAQAEFTYNTIKDEKKAKSDQFSLTVISKPLSNLPYKNTSIASCFLTTTSHRKCMSYLRIFSYHIFFSLHEVAQY